MGERVFDMPQVNMDMVTAWRNGLFLVELTQCNLADVETYRAVYIAEMSGTLRPRVRNAADQIPAIQWALDDSEFDKRESLA